MNTLEASQPAAGGHADSYPRESAADGEAASAAEAERLMRAQLEDLARLRAIGLEIAERVGRKAAGLLLESEQDAFRGCDVVLAYTRVSRTVQQIIMQEQEIVGLRETRVRQVRAVGEAETQQVRAARKVEERRVVRGAVREMVVARRRGLERDELTELLDDLFEDYDDFDRGTPAEIVARICRELRVAFDPAVWGDVAGVAAPPSVDIGEIGANGETPSPASLSLSTLSPLGRGDLGRARGNGHDPP